MSEAADPEHRSRLNALAEGYYALYVCSGDPEHIEMAVLVVTEAREVR